MEFYLGTTYVNITKNNIHIHDSYKITDNKEKVAMLNEIYSRLEHFPRSFKSALREWKAHNVFYKLHLFRKSSMHTDIEAKPLLICRICYFILSIFE